MFIYLIRHGESLANTGNQNPLTEGDAYIGLTEKGKDQARRVGKHFGEEFLRECLIYYSPYERTRETLIHLLDGANIKDMEGLNVYEDPRLREVERGYADESSQHELRKRHGWFYYRHEGGESPADCYDRTSAFLESMMRQVQRNPKASVLIVCHGMTIRCFVTRFLHLRVAQFESMKNVGNCEPITIAPKGTFDAPQFQSGRWEVNGLKIRPGKQV